MAASVKAAESASSACEIGLSPAKGRAEHAKRKTATQDLKDHWSRALKATNPEDAVAELTHAMIAAREAHGSDEYERRTIDMLMPEGGAERVLAEIGPDGFLCPDPQRIARIEEAKHLRNCYGGDHQMGTIVPKGGSSCGNCAYAQIEDDGPHCLNVCWSETPKWRGGGGGETHLPVMDPTRYCCDMWRFRIQGT